MRIVYFTHSLLSCWNHGNAHFLRGVLRELVHRGHKVTAYEQEGGWSLQNLLQDHGQAGLSAYRRNFPELANCTFPPNANLDEMLADADVAIVHEWNDPWLVAAIGKLRREHGSFTLLFHDTHHRAVSDPEAIRRFDLDGYDFVLAFGEALAEVYRSWGWSNRVHVWHEAADTRLFHPPTKEVVERKGLVWIGNWGDEERSADLESFLFRPSQTIGIPLDVYGVRYPDHALRMLARFGATYLGWVPNARVPEIFARHLATVHVPRRFYVDMLPGIPTIRVFEALACGIPLISAPWSDSEGLFQTGTDYLVAKDEAEMERLLEAIRNDRELRTSLARNGWAAIRERHSCTHRVDELLAFLATHDAALATEMSA